MSFAVTPGKRIHVFRTASYRLSIVDRYRFICARLFVAINASISVRIAGGRMQALRIPQLGMPQVRQVGRWLDRPVRRNHRSGDRDRGAGVNVSRTLSRTSSGRALQPAHCRPAADAASVSGCAGAGGSERFS